MLECPESNSLRINFLGKNLLLMNKNIAMIKINKLKDIKEIKNLGKFLYYVKIKWENKIAELM